MTRCCDFDKIKQGNEDLPHSIFSLSLFYLLASAFFDVLRLFGNPDEEMDRRRIYCKWMASEIVKALREGRVPSPGDFVGEDVSAYTQEHLRFFDLIFVVLFGLFNVVVILVGDDNVANDSCVASATARRTRQERV